MHNKIELKKISHHFDNAGKRIQLFDNLNLTLLGGKSHAIVGPSGAGKSSLLTLAAGLEAPKEGKATFILEEQEADAETLRARSGFIFQQFHLMPELDALGNIALPLRLKGRKDAYDTAAQWLEQVGLADRAQHRPNQLSGGEQQRIAIARAFAHEPLFIFADEPTGNLDEATSGTIADLMFDCAAKSNAGLVLVTHSRSLAARADETSRLSAGTLRAGTLEAAA